MLYSPTSLSIHQAFHTLTSMPKRIWNQVFKNGLGNPLLKMWKDCNCYAIHMAQWKSHMSNWTFCHGIDEQLIELQTGHHSDAIRAYEYPVNNHFYQMSNILQPPLPKCVKATDEKTEESPQAVQTPPLAPIQVSYSPGNDEVCSVTTNIL